MTPCKARLLCPVLIDGSNHHALFLDVWRWTPSYALWARSYYGRSRLWCRWGYMHFTKHPKRWATHALTRAVSGNTPIMLTPVKATLCALLLNNWINTHLSQGRLYQLHFVSWVHWRFYVDFDPQCRPPTCGHCGCCAFATSRMPFDTFWDWMDTMDSRCIEFFSCANFVALLPYSDCIRGNPLPMGAI